MAGLEPVAHLRIPVKTTTSSGLKTATGSGGKAATVEDSLGGGSVATLRPRGVLLTAISGPWIGRYVGIQIGGHPRVKTSFALVAACLLLVACTKTIDSGNYGPFKIGESKAECLTKLDKAGIRYVEPLPFQDLSFNQPTAGDLAKFKSSDGIMIWINQHPWPLRIEFANDVVSNTWPEFKPNPNSPAYMQNADKQLATLKSLINIGDSRAKTFAVIDSFGRDHSIAMGNFVVGAEQFRLSPGSYDIDKNDYRSFLLLQDKWKFEGLNDLGWYNAFYSRFTFYFVDGRLVKIEHWRFPFELP